MGTGVHFIIWPASKLPGRRPKSFWDQKEQEVVVIIDNAYWV